MESFAIKVDLSNFFTDARSCSLVLVDATWSNIKDLQDHIQKLFHLTNISLLTSDECYLPPKESIVVLKGVKLLKAFVFNFVEDPKNCCIQDTTEMCRKRKNRSDETDKDLISSTPNFPKRSKCKPVATDETATFLEPAPKHDTLITLNDRKSTKRNKSKRKTVEAEQELEEPVVSSEEPLDETAPPNQSVLLPDANNLSIVKVQNNTNNNHIVYLDNGMETEPNANVTAVEECSQAAKAAAEVEFRCPLIDLDVNTVRTFKLPRKSDPIKILENIIIPPPIPQKSLEAQMVSAVEKADITTEVAAEREPEVEQKMPSPVASPHQAEKDTSVLEAEKEVSEEPSQLAEDTSVLEEEKTDTEEQSQLAEDTSVLEEEKTDSEEPSQVAEQSLLSSDSEDDVMVLDDTNLDDSDDVQAVPVKKDATLDLIADMMQNALPLENLPNVGETLIFKLPNFRNFRESKVPKPSYTQYIAGTCSYVNRRTTQIRINVIASARGINHILRQYANNNCDSSFNETPTLTVYIRELIDAKVIVSEVD